MTHIRTIGFVSRAVAVLLFGTAAFAQKEHEQEAKPEKPQQQHREQARPQQQPQHAQQQQERARPAQQQHAQPAPQQAQHVQRERQQAQPAQQQAQHAQRQQTPQHTEQQARGWQQQRGWAQHGAWQGNSSWRQDRAQNWQAEHRTWDQRGGYGGYYIPEDRFTLSFGSEHWFRINSRLDIVGGYPRFQYGGFMFMLVDPWPEAWSEDWYATDDVYVGYNDGYYLYNRRYPGDGVAISVVL